MIYTMFVGVCSTPHAREHDGALYLRQHSKSARNARACVELARDATSPIRGGSSSTLYYLSAVYYTLMV